MVEKLLRCFPEKNISENFLHRLVIFAAFYCGTV